MVKFWEYLPDQQYRDWRASKVKDRLLATLPVLVPPEIPALEAGAAFGYRAFLDRAKDTLDDIFGPATGTIIRGAKRYNEAQERVAGIPLYGIRSVDPNVFGSSFPGFAIRGLQKITGKSEDRSLPEDFRDVYKATPGVGQFAAKTLVDPLTYVGGIGKVVGSVPKLGKLGSRITAIESLPGKGLEATLGVGSRLGATGLERLGLRSLIEPSTRQAGESAGDVAHNAARVMIDRMEPQGYANNVPLAGIIDQIPAPPKTFKGMKSPLPPHPGLPALQPELPLRATGPATLPQYSLFLESGPIQPHFPGMRAGNPALSAHIPPIPRHPVVAAPKPLPPVLEEILAALSPIFGDESHAVLERTLQAANSPQDFAMKLATAARTHVMTQQSAAIQAGRSGRSGAVLNKLDTVANAWQGSFGKLDRALGRLILGTPAYPVGNAMETYAASALGGVTPKRLGANEAARILSGVGNVPRDVITDAQAPMARMLGTQSDGRIRDWFTGQKWIDLSGRASNPLTRNFWIEKYQEGIAAGLSPDAAAAAATSIRQKAFPMFSDETRLDRAAKAVFPFWQYERSRWPYLARTAANHPGLVAPYLRYRQESDEGYITGGQDFGPLADYQINPLRGTSFNAIAGLTRPEFPTFAQGKSGTIEHTTNLLGRAGFYPGAATNLGLAGIRAVEGEPVEPGSLVPTAAGSLLNAAQGLGSVPGLGDLPVVSQIADLTTNAQNEVLDDRFRRYYVRKELALQGINPDTATSEQVREAEQAVGRRLFLLTNTGMFRFRPEIERQYKQDRITEAIRAGVPEDIARSTARTGNPISAIDPNTNAPYLNSATRRGIYNQNPTWENWQAVSEPLRNRDAQNVLVANRAYFAALEDIDRRTADALDTLYRAVEDNPNLISGEQFRKRRGDILAAAASARQQAGADHPQALQTPEQREAFYRAQGRDLSGERPEDLAARAYYSIQPQIGPNGLIDFETFRNSRAAVLASLDPATQAYIQNEYPRRKYQDNPRVAAGEAQYQDDLRGLQGYFDMPRYLGITEDQNRQITEAQGLLASLRQRYPGIPDQDLIGLIGRVNPFGAAFLEYTSRYGTEDVRNPLRQEYLVRNPNVVRMLSRGPLGTLDNLLDQ